MSPTPRDKTQLCLHILLLLTIKLLRSTSNGHKTEETEVIYLLVTVDTTYIIMWFSLILVSSVRLILKVTKPLLTRKHDIETV